MNSKFCAFIQVGIIGAKKLQRTEKNNFLVLLNNK